MAEDVRAVTQRGEALLQDPTLNKGSAFTEQERGELGLVGLLPPAVSTLEQQMARVLENFRAVSESLTADDRARGLVLPDASQLRGVGARVAAAAMIAAAEEGVAGRDLPADPQQFVRDWRYAPRYQRYVPA